MPNPTLCRYYEEDDHHPDECGRCRHGATESRERFRWALGTTEPEQIIRRDDATPICDECEAYEERK